MGLRIRTNVASLNAQRTLQNTTQDMSKNMEKMSSGYRINKAADDAAGLAISETIKSQVRSLGQAKRNAGDGVSLIQIAEGSMNEISNILIRLRELATQASSDTIGNRERSYTNSEYVELVKEVDRIASTTKFNGIPLLKGEDALADPSMFTIHVGAGDGLIENTDTINFGVEKIAMDSTVLGLGTESEIGPQEVDGDFSRETAAEKLTILESALEKVSHSRAYIGSQQSRLGHTINNLGTQIENMSAANSRIRDADFADVMASFTSNKILQQAGASVLSQANSSQDIALSLLR